MSADSDVTVWHRFSLPCYLAAVTASHR